MRILIGMLASILLLNAGDMKLIKITEFRDIVKIKSSKGSVCTVDFQYNANNAYDTNCLEKINSKDVTIFCTYDKKICKTLAEITYLKESKHILPNKPSQSKPFVGTRFFDFAGGSGTGMMIKIYKNGVAKIYSARSMRTEYRGKLNSKKSPYWIRNNIICSKSSKGRLDMCTMLHKM